MLIYIDYFGGMLKYLYRIIIYMMEIVNYPLSKREALYIYTNLNEDVYHF